MKRLLVLCLALMLLLSSCAGGHTFLRAEDGSGYTDSRSDLFYKALDPAYEPAKAEDEVFGEYTDKEREITYTFRAIPGLDPTLFLTDDNLIVYYAGETLPNAADWKVTAVLVCEEDAISVERFRFSAGEDDAVIEELRTLWFEGAGDALLPIGAPDYTRRIKLTAAAYPNLFYCFYFYGYESGEGYFYDAVSRRTVSVPASLVDELRPVAAEEEE